MTQWSDDTVARVRSNLTPKFAAAPLVRPNVGDIFWVAVCHPNETPDGPARFIGPYRTREMAELDVWMATTVAEDEGSPCRNQHYVGQHRWTDDSAQRMCIASVWHDDDLMALARWQHERQDMAQDMARWQHERQS